MPGSEKLVRIEPPEFVSVVVERLRLKGYEVYIVGGAVRDAILGRNHQDWDLTTNASAPDIHRIFSDIGHYQLKHDTVTLVRSHQKIEVTPYRAEQGADLRRDLALRDFTINAMAYCPSRGHLIDYFGGLEDLRRKKIRAVGNPLDRFKEDPLRLIRAIRIAVELGLQIEPSTWHVLKDMAPLISDCAMERIREELIKILLIQKPSTGFSMLRRAGLLGHIIPELLEGYLKRQNRYHRYTIFKHTMVTMDSVPPMLLLRLVALLHDIAKPRVRVKESRRWRFIGHEHESAKLAQDIMHRLRFSSSLIHRVAHLVRHHMINYSPQWNDAALRRWARKVGIDNVHILTTFRKADLIAHGTDIAAADLRLLGQFEQRIEEILRRENTVTSSSDLSINGRDVMKILGIGPGPRVGKILEELMELVTENPELNTREHLVDILRKDPRFVGPGAQ